MSQVTKGIGGVVALLCAWGAAAQSPPQAGCSESKKKCWVDVTVRTGGTCADVNLEPEKVKVRERDRGPDYRIIWRLERDYVFRPSLGDGVVIKRNMQGAPDDQGEFASGVVSDDDDGDPSAKARGSRWRWRYLNSVDGKFEYSIQFRHKDTGRVYVCDPVITNIEAG